MIQFGVEKLHRIPEELDDLTLEGLEEAFEEYALQAPKKRAPSHGVLPEAQRKALGLDLARPSVKIAKPTYAKRRR